MSSEKRLPDDYPVIQTYYCVADDAVIESPLNGTILDLKNHLIKEGISCEEITNCDIFERGLTLN